jgi:hypothetical protein
VGFEKLLRIKQANSFAKGVIHRGSLRHEIPGRRVTRV